MRPGFPIRKWPRLRHDLTTLGQAEQRVAVLRAIAAQHEEQQAADERTWEAIQWLPAKELDALRQAARRDRAVARDVGEGHPALEATMIELSKERDDRQPRLRLEA